MSKIELSEWQEGKVNLSGDLFAFNHNGVQTMKGHDSLYVVGINFNLTDGYSDEDVQHVVQLKTKMKDQQ